MSDHKPTHSVTPDRSTPAFGADPAVTRSVADGAAVTGDGLTLAGTNSQPIAPTRYTLSEEIARGGMGVVYRATDTVLGREVAIKVLQDKFGAASGAARRFADEARITSQLQHPSIPPVHDLGHLSDGRPFLAMKLVKGRTLDALLDARPDPAHDRGRFVAAFEQVCQALAYAHAHNVIHRDLKPANVMVGNFGEVQVMDWGLAKVLGARDPESHDPAATAAATRVDSLRDSDGAFTQAGSVLGTPAFMPPEQAIGAVAEIDTRSDVFGLGAILAGVLTGAPPFAADTAEESRVKSARGDVGACFARLDTCGADPDLVALCKRCLAPKAADRPADAGVVAKAVAELRQAADERARQAELERVRLEGEQAAARVQATERRKRRRVWIGAAAGLAAAVIVGLGAVLAVQHRANAALTEEQAKVEARNRALADEQAKVQARFELAQKAIATFHTGVSEDVLLKNEQFKDLRTKLLGEAAGFYADLEKLLEGQTDVRSRKTLAAAYFQLAELTEKIGSKPEALAAHRKALELRRELAALPGADLEARLDVARSLGTVGYLLYMWGDAEGALRTFAEQHDVITVLLPESRSDAVQSVQAQGLIYTSAALWKVGEPARALACVQKARAILRRVVAGAEPVATEPRYHLASALIRESTVLWDLGRWAEVLTVLEEAHLILEKLAEDDTSTQFRYKLTLTHNNRSNVLIDVGKPAEGLVAAEKARAISQRLTDSHPAVTQFQGGLAVNYLNIGRALAETGEPTGAAAALAKAVTIWQTLSNDNPTDSDFQFWLAYCHNERGELLARIGEPEEALKVHETAGEFLVIPAKVGTTFHWVQVERARRSERTGLLLSVLGKPAEALAACEEGLTIRQQLNVAQPANAWLKAELANSLSISGTVQQRTGRPADAVGSVRRAIALVEQLPALTPRNHFTLACCRAQLAGLASDTGSGLTAEQGAAEAERAMAALRQAVTSGFSSIALLQTDRSLDALRPREDFRKLVKDLEERLPKRPELAPPPREVIRP